MTAYRLPRNVTPQAYHVDLDASPKRKSFSGAVTITARVQEPSELIELHGRGLKISTARATWTAKGKKRRVKGRPKLHASRETIELRFDSPIPKGKIELDLEFKGTLSKGMNGLYLAKNGKEKAIVSQCEATDARAIFPCFDEPDMKATLQWTIRTDPGMTVITNGVKEKKVSRTRGDAPREVHRFKKTRVISTYLAAVTIGDFEATKARRVSKIPCRVLCAPGREDQTDFAQDVTAFVIPWYEEYFGHRYNYQKLDQVAVPGFDAGAMENVGAIFYRQTLLLMKPGSTSWDGQKRIAEVVAHEIAHQWFGNLVTMKWWDDLWLNEAFATWVAFKVCDEWKPHWRMWDDFLVLKEAALSADALTHTHPIYTPVESPAEATELFDLITYEKGCAVLRMAEGYLGKAAFRKGIRAYIDAFKNSNAAGPDLWTSLEKASKQPVDNLMKNWVSQSGFPLVSATLDRSGDTPTLHLKQRRFFSSAEKMEASNDQTWMIPLVIKLHDGRSVKEQRVLMDGREKTVELPKGTRWVYPNADASGFYRLHLDSDILSGILEHGLPTPADRLSLLHDQWALVRNGLAHVDQFLDVLSSLRGEKDHIVTRTMASRLRTIDAQLVEDASRAALADFTAWLFEPQYSELGWEPAKDEEPAVSVRRSAVLSVLGQVATHPDVLQEAETRLQAEIDAPDNTEPNLAGALVQLAAIRGKAQQLDRYVQTYLARRKQGASPEVQGRYLMAFAGFREPAVVKRVLDMCMDGTVPQESIRTVLVQLLSSRSNGEIAWKFMKKNWKDLAPRVGSMGMARLVEATGALSPTLQKDVLNFFKKNPAENASRAVQKAAEAMDLRRELVSREASRLADWLRKAKRAPSATA